MEITPNRVAVLLTIVAGVAGAVAPAVADMDWSSTAGVIAGVAAIAVAVVKWLDGWQRHEERVADSGSDTSRSPAN